MTVTAAGILYKCGAEVLLIRRTMHSDEPGTWGIPGGKLEPNEIPELAAMRESFEEVGYIPRNPITPFDLDVHNGVEFQTFLCELDCRFDPVLNDEHSQFAWIPIMSLPRDTHPGVKKTIRKSGGAAVDSFTADHFERVYDGKSEDASVTPDIVARELEKHRGKMQDAYYRVVHKLMMEGKLDEAMERINRVKNSGSKPVNEAYKAKIRQETFNRSHPLPKGQDAEISKNKKLYVDLETQVGQFENELKKANQRGDKKRANELLNYISKAQAEMAKLESMGAFDIKIGQYEPDFMSVPKGYVAIVKKKGMTVWESKLVRTRSTEAFYEAKSQAEKMAASKGQDADQCQLVGPNGYVQFTGTKAQCEEMRKKKPKPDAFKIVPVKSEGMDSKFNRGDTVHWKKNNKSGVVMEVNKAANGSANKVKFASGATVIIPDNELDLIPDDDSFDAAFFEKAYSGKDSMTGNQMIGQKVTLNDGSGRWKVENITGGKYYLIKRIMQEGGITRENRRVLTESEWQKLFNGMG